MKKRTDLISQIQEIHNNDIKVETYTGFSYLHIDLVAENKPALWCAIACEEEFPENTMLDLKISDINDIVFKYDDKAEDLIEMLIKICREIGVTKIHGRVAIINDFETIKKFYEKFGFTVIHTPNEKNFDSAKISLIL